MKLVSANACAKTILFGEYSVVYGRPAIAIPIPDLRARVEVQQTGVESGLELLSSTTDERVLFTEDFSKHPFYQLLHITLERLSIAIPNARITIKSNIPVSSGLGSSASVSTALVRAIYAFAKVPLDSKITSEIVFEVEKIYHGTPSGIDNTVIAYEKPLYFIRDRVSQHFEITEPFNFLLADTGVRSTTKVAIEALDMLRKQDEEYVENIFTQMGDIANKGYHALLQGDIEGVGIAMNENQNLLQLISASSTELDSLIKTAIDFGAYGAKLTGKGRGGNALILTEATKSEVIKKSLLAAGAVAVHSTKVGSVDK